MNVDTFSHCIINAPAFFLMMKFKPTLILVLAMAFLAFPASFVGANEPAPKTVETKRILFISSYAFSYDWARDVFDGFNEYFRASGMPVEIGLLELYSLRGGDMSANDEIIKTVLGKIREDRPHALILSDMPIYDLFKAYYKTDLRDIPIVFCGFPEFLAFAPSAHPNSTVVKQNVEVFRNVQLGMRLLPNTKEIAVITDSSIEGVAVQENAKKALADFAGAKVIYLNGNDYSTDEMLRMVSAMQKDSFIIYGNWKSAKSELFVSYTSSIEKILSVARGPVFSLIDLHNPNVLGGYMSNGIIDGRVAASVAENVLEGFPIREIPPLSAVEVLKFNWEVMEKYGIAEGSLPVGSLVVGKPRNFFFEYKYYIIFGIAAAAGLVLWLMWSIRRYTHAERNDFIYSKLPVSIVVFDGAGNIVFRQSEALDTLDAAEGRRKNISEFRKYEAMEEFMGDFFPAYERVSQDGGEEVVLYDWAGRRKRGVLSKLPAGKFGKDSVMLVSVDVTELENMRRELQTTVEHERIVNECLKFALSGSDIQSLSDAALEIMGMQLGADRSYIFVYDGVRAEINNTAEWCADGIEPQRLFLQNVPDDCVYHWTKAFSEGRLVSTDNLAEDDTPEFLDSRPVLQAQGIKTLLTAGIWSAGRLWGFVGIDFVKKAHIFTDADRNMLQSIAKIFELFLEGRRVIEVLEYSEAEKSLMLDSIQIPILMYDKKGLLTRANPAAAKMMDMPLDEMLGKNGEQKKIFAGDSEMHIMKCVYGNRPVSFESAVNSREYLNLAYPISDKGGKVANAIVSSVDMTDFNENNRKLVKAVEAAKAADKAKSLFLATISHELRTPLNAVIGYSELSQARGISESERIDNLKNINISANALLTLVNDVLDLSKLESGQMEMVKTPTDMREMANELLGIFRFRTEKAGISISAEVSPEMPPLMLDTLRLKQVLVNIMGNAVKFTDHGGVSLEVLFVRTARTSGLLSISVSDTGMGIHPEYIEKIFNPFERQPQNLVKGLNAYEGTGLGLAISQRLMREMGGSIQVESRLGEGSKFTMSIPNVEVSDVEAPSSARTLRDPFASKVSFSDAEILIVDDVIMNLNVLEAILKKLGVKVERASSGKEALEKAKTRRPSLILTDLWMPEMNGEEFARLAKADPSLSGIPIVVVTADTQMEDADRVFDDALLKPITVLKVDAILHKYLTNASGDGER